MPSQRPRQLFEKPVPQKGNHFSLMDLHTDCQGISVSVNTSIQFHTETSQTDTTGQSPPKQRPPWTETPLDRDPPWTETLDRDPGQRPPGQRPSLWTETPSGQGPLGQRPPTGQGTPRTEDPLDRDPPGHVNCGSCWDRVNRMTHRCKEITLPQLCCGRL